MRYVSLLPRLLLRLPARWQVVLVSGTFLLSALLFALGFPSRLNGSLLGIPLAFAIWLFGRRGVQIGLISTLALIFLVNTLTVHTLIWPLSLFIIYLIGSLALVSEALIIYSLRYALDVSEAARQKSRLAERQIGQAYEQEKQLHELKDRLLVSINHELRTPLTGLLGYLQLLLELEERLDEATRRGFLTNACRLGEELQALVNTVSDTLNAQRTDAPVPPARERVCLLTAVQDVLAGFDPRVREEHPICLSIPEHLAVAAHPQSLRQVLRNLLSNAFKYAPRSGVVEVSARYTRTEQQEDDTVLVSVKDEGPGIPPAELPLLFEPFVRLKRDVAGPVRGTGLGLYLSRCLLEEMGGMIWGESSGVAGEGSRFCFTLPVAAYEARTR
jgi:signal transduction histidine kinase